MDGGISRSFAVKEEVLSNLAKLRGGEWSFAMGGGVYFATFIINSPAALIIAPCISDGAATRVEDKSGEAFGRGCGQRIG